MAARRSPRHIFLKAIAGGAQFAGFFLRRGENLGVEVLQAPQFEAQAFGSRIIMEDYSNMF